jgi:protein-S-isoprenylcysteine O-methyltransferase Ste14
VRVIAAISLTIWGVLHVPVFDHYFGFRLPNVLRIPGIVLLTMGGGLVLWCGGILSRVGILEERGDRLFPAEFVARGPFRYVRNPMSLGGTLLFMGLGLYVRSISILVFSCLLFLPFHILAVYFEEPGLTKRWAAGYLELGEVRGELGLKQERSSRITRTKNTTGTLWAHPSLTQPWRGAVRWPLQELNSGREPNTRVMNRQQHGVRV